jgi:hypothetical protein
MATTTNYGWAEPDNTSLVKNGAQDIRILGDAIDASLWNVGFGQAGKNKIINGDFGIWQRGTSFSNPNDSTYNADRWLIEHDGTGATRTISQQTFTPAAAPVAGYESTYFLRYAVSGGTGNTYQQIEQRVEDVRILAGNTVTLSFWAKADAARTVSILYRRSYGSGGSTAEQTSVGSAINITTSWVRYSVTTTVASLSGKTIGAGSFTQWILRFAAATAQTIDIWGVQLEYGSTATPFETASGSLQGELAMCQRYYVRYSAADLSLGNYAQLSQTGFCVTTMLANLPFAAPATLRTKPTSVDYANVELLDTQAISVISGGTFTVANGTGTQTLSTLYAHTAATLTAGKQVILRNSNNVNGYFGWSAEL